jgi:hypothetical protein
MPALDAPVAEIAVGVSRFMAQRDGVWYQKGFPHEIVLTSVTAQLGMTGSITESTRWRAGYKYLGKFSSSAEAVSDANYNQQTKSCNGPCEPVQHFYGTGSIQAVYATLDPEWYFGGHAVSVEIGPTLYRATWVEEVPDWRPCEGVAPCGRQAIAVRHHANWQTGAVLGAGVRFGRTTYRAGIWFAEAGGDIYPGVYDCCGLDLSIGVEF